MPRRQGWEQNGFYALHPQFRSDWGFDPQARFLDLLGRSREYYLWIAVAPRTGDDQVASGDSVEHDFIVPPGSILWGLTASYGVSGGFRFALWNEGRLAVPRLNAENLAGTSRGAAPNTGSAAIPHLLDPPYPVLGNGLMHVKITNLATATNGLQLVMFFAAPAGGAS
jgi:hypothetical protein